MYDYYKIKPAQFPQNRIRIREYHADLLGLAYSFLLWALVLIHGSQHEKGYPQDGRDYIALLSWCRYLGEYVNI